MGILLTIGFACTARGQDTTHIALEGYVNDAETGAPLPNAHVFIVGSLTGTVTDSTGRYELDDVPRGANRLYASMMGYKSSERTMLLDESGTYALSFQLQPTVLPAGEVTVTAERDAEWARYVARFQADFLGTTPNADSTRILNPDVLRFTLLEDRLTARAVAPLRIENRALGYHVRYHLESFTAMADRTAYFGTAEFDTLRASSPQDRARWEANRRAAFRGSFPHFVQSILRNQSDEAGFRTFAVSRYRWLETDAASLLQDGPAPAIKRLAAEDRVLIRYRDRRWSRLELEESPVLVDIWGRLVHPDRVVFHGYMGKQRVADLLPVQYRPN